MQCELTVLVSPAWLALMMDEHWVYFKIILNHFIPFSYHSTNEEEPSRSSASEAAAELPEQVEEREEEEDEERPGPSSRAPEEKDGGEGGEEEEEGGEEGEKNEGVEAVLTEEDLIQQSQAEYDSGRYSPVLLQPSELPLDTHVVDAEEDLQRLQLARRQLQVTGVCTISLLCELKFSNK